MVLFLSHALNRLEVGRCLTLRHVVPILGVPDALVPVNLPFARISLLPGYIFLLEILTVLSSSNCHIKKCFGKLIL